MSEDDDWLQDLGDKPKDLKEVKTLEELDEKIEAEAKRLFKQLAIEEIAATNPEYSIASTYECPEPNSDFSCLYRDLLKLSDVGTEFVPIKDWNTGELIDVIEVWKDDFENEGDSRSSLSLNRTVDTKGFANFMGSANNIPFMPGGLDADEQVDRVLNMGGLKAADGNEEAKYLDFEGKAPEELLNIPPGFSFGINFTDLENSTKASEKEEHDNIEKASQKEEKKEMINIDDMDIIDLIDFVSSGAPFSKFKPKAESPTPAASEAKVPEVKEGSQEDEHPGHAPALTVEEREELEAVLADEVPPAPLPPVQETLQANRDPEFPFARVVDVTKTVKEYENLKESMARKYPFELDPFQQQAIVCMERGDSVFVAAHTSAGKTVVAEYSVALCRLHKTRVIYTSPIKALSNQKFREFKAIFDDVGLITGDIQLQPEAFALIMTTEVLKSMLYNGSEVIRELEWVIFDEVHYINDAERGHVWEEVLIMLPAHVKIVMLSATVPNCVEFADWVGRIKNREIYVITTSRRPVPLEHYLYTGQDGKTRKDLFKIVDSQGQFLNMGYKLASDAKANLRKVTSGPLGYRANTKSDKNIYTNLIYHLREKELLPMVVFVFSRRRCDENAELLQSVDLTDAKEKRMIHRFFEDCIERLKGSDRKLPQVLKMGELCMRGFAVHHSGILPILKEIVELLFQKGFVKVLFATETFAMGVNMPARTVVFDSMQKHDGREIRFLTPGEYIQMAGRAGRRGLDPTGTVVVLCKGPNVPEPTMLTHMLLGKPTKLESRFRVTYSMLLNLLRVEHVRIEDMLQRSYVESASLRQALFRKTRLKEIEGTLVSFPKLECSVCCSPPEGKHSILEYHNMVRSFVGFRSELWLQMFRFANFDKMFSPGRLVIVSLPQINRVATLAVVLKTIGESNRKLMQLLITAEDNADTEKEEKRLMDSFHKLTQIERNWKMESGLIESAIFVGLERIALPVGGSQLCRSTYRILDNIPVACLLAVCQKSLKVDTAAVYSDAEMRVQPRFRSRSPETSVMKLIMELEMLSSKWAASAEGPPVALPGREIQISEAEMFDRINNLNKMRNALVDKDSFPCRHCLSFREHLDNVRQKVRLEEERDALKLSLSTDGLLLSQEYTDRIQVLRRLQYIDETNMISLKGKISCEIHHQELLITELLLDNKIQYRSLPEIAAILSTMTCQHKSRASSKKNGIQPPVILEELKADVLEVANRIAFVERECGVKTVNISEELSFDLMHVVYEWANGLPFAQIMELTDAQEGLIVRCIQRLDEVCKDIRNAARIVGDPNLYEKMEAVSASVKRDIVFAASLYTVVQ